MITVRKELDIPCQYDLSRLGDPGKLLFFDIETTGLSPYASSLYLIGCLYREDGRWQFVQWLAESLSDELDMLRAFDGLVRRFDVLVHFNGDTFDLPYLKTAAEQYGYAHAFDTPASFDILKQLRKKKRFFGLPNLRLKTVERFLGIFREDRFSGGELIEIYQQYTQTKDERLMRLFLLHNEDDLKGMLKILPVLNYCDLLDRPALDVSEHWFSASGSELFAVAKLRDAFPAPLSYETLEGARLKIENGELSFRIPCFFGTLKYYYPDWKDYYYLPVEDTAIHKKVASFVDPHYRKQATKDTCYTKADGVFLPALPHTASPVFRAARTDKAGFVQFSEAMLGAYLEETLRSV